MYDCGFFDDDDFPLLTDWSIFGGNDRRCVNCDRYKKEKGFGDFVCKHVRGFVEAPSRVKRCKSCDDWKNREGISGDFWCRHRKEEKDRWNNCLGWEGSAERARAIKKRL